MRFVRPRGILPVAPLALARTIPQEPARRTPLQLVPDIPFVGPAARRIAFGRAFNVLEHVVERGGRAGFK